MNTTSHNFVPKIIERPSHQWVIESETFRFWLFLSVMMLIVFNIDSVSAGVVDNLREPMKALKSEVWSYTNVIVIAAALIGAAGSAVKGSPAPFASGIAVAAGLTFFDSVIGDGSAALI